MDRVHHAQDKPFDLIRSAGIAIRELNPEQRHIGMLYRDSASNQILFLHLAWHFDLRHDAPRHSYLWVDPAITARRLVQVAAVCRLVWRANGRNAIPYGFGPPSDCLAADTGEYLFGPTGFGLTCATFVLAVFHRAGLKLVRYAAWPIGRPGDPEWQRRIVEELRNHTPTATLEHVRAIERDIGTTVRFRPEEVAGAATVTPQPAGFHIACERGEQILIRLRKPHQTQSQRILLQSVRQWIRELWAWIKDDILGS